MFQIFNTIDDKSYQMMGRSRKHRVHPSDRSLRLKDVGAEDQGWYQCRLTTDFDTSSYNVSLEVLGRAPSIFSPFSPLILMQGSNHSLRCEASGVPVPGITWTLNDQFLPEDNPRVRTSRRLLDGGGEGGAGNAVNVLRLVNATGAESGDFTCLAENAYGTTAKTVKVRVIAPTAVDIAGSKDVLEADAGTRLKIPCRVLSDKQNNITNLEWRKDGAPIGHSADDRINFG